jgi:two-component system cell cycle sensor histidine kinase/response regulator CckA
MQSPKATILVVEDDEPIRTLAARVLHHTGYEVLVAADSPEALRLADAYPSVIQVLIVDITLPSGNGIALARAILAKRPESAVLYISGFEADALRTVQDGRAPMGGFLEKPFSPDMLVNRVRSIVGASNAKKPSPSH